MHPLDFLLRRFVPLGLFGLGVTVATIGWFTQPEAFRKGFAPEQPIPFSHQLHAGTLQMHCAYCHSGAWRSPVAGLPDGDLCMGCHRVTRVESPSIQALARIQASGAPLRWQRIHALPDHAVFDHRPHVWAGIACQDCHGDLREQAVAERRMSLRMGACLDCHRNPEHRGPEHCSACHR